MEQPEKILKKWYNPLHGIGEIAELQIVEAMKEYAEEVAKEALKNASDNYVLICKYEESSKYTVHEKSFYFDEHYGMKDFLKREVKVLKSSILNESNIPEQ